MEADLLQHYWWILISILGGLLVFLLFIQGGQSLLYTIGRDRTGRDLIINTLGHKWEYTFTTLVVFGGAFFASFPLFYATSFGGAYLVWMLILFCFVIQAVSYEYRSKKNNLLGTRTYEAFLQINGFCAPFLLGAAVATFYTGASFRLTDLNEVVWTSPWRGLEALAEPACWLLGLTLVFLSRCLGALFLLLTVDDKEIAVRSRHQAWTNAVPAVVLLLAFLCLVFLGEGYAADPSGKITLEKYKYLENLVDMPANTLLFILGVGILLYGILRTRFSSGWNRGIWFAGAGTIATVISLFILAGFNGTAFYPSATHPASSLTIANASSSPYTLKAMSYVSLIIPFVAAYIWYVWKKLTDKPMDRKELEETENRY